MKRSIRPFSRSEKIFLAACGLVGTVGLSAIVGIASVRYYDKTHRLPDLVDRVYERAQDDLIQRAQVTYRNDDLAMLSFISGLRQNGVAEAYKREISMLRRNAFESTRESRSAAAIRAIDTRPADGLLLDAVSKLNDADLLSVLSEKRGIFESRARSKDLENAGEQDKELLYRDAYYSHTTLSEKDKDSLASCLQKLTENSRKVGSKIKLKSKFGSCIPEYKRSSLYSFDAESFLKYNY